MIKIFISQPMNGKTEEEIRFEREIAIKDAKKQVEESFPEDWDVDGNQSEIMDTFFKDFAPGIHPLVYLGESIKMLAEADVVYFARGWQNALGCCIEHDCAKKYGKYVMHY